MTNPKTKSYLKSLAVLLILAGTFVLPLRGAQPLSKDDISLLLIGGASESKMITLVEQRGVDFQLTPELIQKFQKEGASQALIDVIVNSNRNKAVKHTGPVTEAPSGTATSVSGISPELPGSAPQVSNISNPPAPVAQPRTSSSAAGSQSVHNVAATQGEAPPPLASGARKATEAPSANLSDPSPAEIQKIIHAFAAKEQMFKQARDNYTYRQINKVETLDTDGRISGVWQQNWDILFDNNGNRIEKVTYAPPSSLTAVSMTAQDMEALRHTQPFVLTTDNLGKYEIKYLGHVKVDYITAYVFSVRPKEIKKHQVYFKGVVWVDDRDLQIVKAQGRQVPQISNSKGQNLFPQFTTWRQQIDGKFWFPTFTLADDTLYFAQGPVHIKEIIRYTDYKQFKSTSIIKAVQAIDTGKPIPATNSSTPSSQPAPKDKK